MEMSSKMILFLTILGLGNGIYGEYVTVNLKENLAIKGTRFQVPELQNTRKIYQFLGIEYAHIPERFAEPESPHITNGTIEATNFGPICYQDPNHLKRLGATKLPKMSEDCLYLNLWTPTLNSTANLPVIFYIHAGMFNFGYGNAYKGDILATLHNVVYISINYRLSVLGMFSTGDDVVPGNLALLDQLEALKWVNQNIAKFGGDPTQVTLAGLSSGSMSVSYHIVSPLSRGLFKRGILQSGSSLNHFVRTKSESKERLKKAAEILGITSDDSSTIMKAMKDMEPEALVNMSIPWGFRPTIDGRFFPDLPINLYNKKEFAHVDIITGFTENDGFFIMEMMYKLLGMKGKLDPHNMKQEVKTLLNKFFARILGVQSEEFANLVYEEYIGNNSQWEDIVQNTETLFRDGIFAASAFDEAQRHTGDHCNVFVYEYKHKFTGRRTKSPPFIVADHMSDHMMHIGQPLRSNTNVAYNLDDQKLSKRIMQYWVNFATNGNPNSDNAPFWPEYTCKGQKYLELDMYPKVQAMYSPERVKLWMETMFKMDTKRKGVYVERYNPCDHSHEGDHTHDNGHDGHTHVDDHDVKGQDCPTSSAIKLLPHLVSNFILLIIIHFLIIN